MASPRDERRRKYINRVEAAMWVLALEAVVALGMLILIVWLTMASSRRRDDANKAASAPDRPSKTDEK